MFTYIYSTFIQLYADVQGSSFVREKYYSTERCKYMHTLYVLVCLNILLHCKGGRSTSAPSPRLATLPSCHLVILPIDSCRSHLTVMPSAFDEHNSPRIQNPSTILIKDIHWFAVLAVLLAGD